MHILCKSPEYHLQFNQLPIIFFFPSLAPQFNCKEEERARDIFTCLNKLIESPMIKVNFGRSPNSSSAYFDYLQQRMYVGRRMLKFIYPSLSLEYGTFTSKSAYNRIRLLILSRKRTTITFIILLSSHSPVLVPLRSSHHHLHSLLPH